METNKPQYFDIEKETPVQPTEHSYIDTAKTVIKTGTFVTVAGGAAVAAYRIAPIVSTVGSVLPWIGTGIKVMKIVPYVMTAISIANYVRNF